MKSERKNQEVSAEELAVKDTVQIAKADFEELKISKFLFRVVCGRVENFQEKTTADTSCIFWKGRKQFGILPFLCE